jgi:hypothetical protein
MAWGRLTSPSSNPSPVVAQLGTTNHILSFSCESLSASVTSWGFIAVMPLVCALPGRSIDVIRGKGGTYLRGDLACLQRLAVTSLSFPGH